MSNINEEALEKYEQVKLLLRRFIFLNDKTPQKKNIWFEKSEIRKDSEYYKTIIQIIDSFLKYCENFKYIIEISKTLELSEEYFIEIISGLLCLGHKKESAINSPFVDSIKEFSLDERIQNSKYSSLIKDIEYQNIDQDFLCDLNSLFSLILNNGSEENIKILIKKLKKSEESKGQRISSVSTNFENNEEESKCDIYNNKSEEESLSTPNKQESPPKNFSSIAQNPLLSSSPEKNNSPKLIEKSSSAISDEIKPEINEDNNKTSEKRISIQNVQQRKNDMIPENSSQSGPKTSENNDFNNFKQDLSKLNEKKLNNEIIINKSPNSFENFKKLLENNSNNDKTEEKAENKEEIQLENKINNVVLTIFQRYNKYNILLQQKSKFANSLKEYYLIEKFRNEITEDKAIIGKLEIQINEMKSIIKYLLPANIANIKRKILDIVNYSIFKQNKDSFEIDENYCPNKSFLDKIYDKLINFSKKDNLPEDQKTKVKDRIVFIDAQKNKKNSSTTFPYKCVDDDLDDILKFFSFYKKELNNIVHISKDAMKYYLLPFNKEINQ